METAPQINVDVLRAARERAGLTQHELARVVGVVGGERISMWERGEARPRSPRLLRAVADAVGVPAVELLAEPADGPTLRWLRFTVGLSLDEVAAAAHVSAASLKRWEGQGCRRPPAASTLEALATVLHVTPSTVATALRRP